MMNADSVINLIQTTVLLFVLLGTIQGLGSGKYRICAVFFAFAVACHFLSNLYWLAYTVLRPGTWMPFAANEICEWALFLLLGASLRTNPFHPSAKWEVLGAALFAAANVALWIAWSGEWVQDILTGAAFGYFLCCLTVRLGQEDIFPVRERRLFGAACLVLIALQTVIFFVPKEMGQYLDLLCYFLLFAVAAILLIRAFQACGDDARPTAAVLCSFAAFAWMIITMYMSTGGFYSAAMLLTALCYLMLFRAIRKEAVS